MRFEPAISNSESSSSAVYEPLLNQSQPSGDFGQWAKPFRADDFANLEEGDKTVYMPKLPKAPHNPLLLFGQLADIISNDAAKVKAAHPSPGVTSEKITFFTDRVPVYDKHGNLKTFETAKSKQGQVGPYFGEVEVTGPAVMPRFVVASAELQKQKHTPVVGVPSLYDSENTFLQVLKDKAESSPTHKVAVYIPGYGTDFKYAADEAAAVQEKLHMPVVLYSWPSKGAFRIAAYTNDEDAAQRSLAINGSRIIADIENTVSASNLSLVGFSLGGRMEERYVWERYLANSKAPSPPPPLDNEIYVRADLDSAIFYAHVKALIDSANHTLVVAAPNDRALHDVSGKIIHDDKRLGSIPTKQYDSDKLTVIDDSTLTNGTTNHILYPPELADWLDAQAAAK